MSVIHLPSHKVQRPPHKYLVVATRLVHCLVQKRAESLSGYKIAESPSRYKISALNRDHMLEETRCHFVFATLVFRVKEPSLTGTYEMRRNCDERSAKKSRTNIFMRQKRANVSP